MKCSVELNVKLADVCVGRDRSTVELKYINKLNKLTKFYLCNTCTCIEYETKTGDSRLVTIIQENLNYKRRN